LITFLLFKKEEAMIKSKSYQLTQQLAKNSTVFTDKKTSQKIKVIIDCNFLEKICGGYTNGKLGPSHVKGYFKKGTTVIT
jgi:hypothetical protein